MKTLMVFLAVALVPSAAFAGANAGACIIPGAGAWTTTTSCANLQRSDVGSIDPSYPSPGGPDNYVAVYIARPYSPGLSVSGIDFGIAYGGALAVTGWTRCGDLELPTSGWPQSGSGNSVVWASPVTGQVVLVGWFRVTVYAGRTHEQYLFTLGENPYWHVMRVLDPSSNFDSLGCCLGDCSADFYNPSVAVQSRTWGAIKAQYRD